jgi:hypothetical protein
MHVIQPGGHRNKISASEDLNTSVSIVPKKLEKNNSSRKHVLFRRRKYVRQPVQFQLMLCFEIKLLQFFLMLTKFLFKLPVVNANDCFLTRMQEMSMDYHFKVEQEAGSSLCNFFGYNGTCSRSLFSAAPAQLFMPRCHFQSCSRNRTEFIHARRNRWSVEDTGDCRVRWLGGPNHC